MNQPHLPGFDPSTALSHFTVPSSSSWLPYSIRERIQTEGQITRISGFSRAEKRVLRKRPRIPISQWAEKHRWVRVSSREGQWSNTTTPYLAGVMDGIGFPSVRDATICATPQSGKTEAVYNCLGYWIDHDPGPVLIVYADETTSKEEKDERIDPMIDDSPRLRSYKTKAARDTTALRLSLQHMVIHMAWATSVARLATKPKRYVIFDEVDKYPASLKKETDPISLGIKRSRTYPDDKKIVRLSTPTWEQGPIWRSLNDCQSVFHYHVRCPECLHWQKMDFGDRESGYGIKWSEDIRDPNDIETGKLAWYLCPHCKAKWDDTDRDRAVRFGKWREASSGRELMDELQLKKPSRIGFHIPAWLSTFVSLSECAASFLRSQGDKTRLKDFMNAIKAEPWVEYEVEREEDDLLALKDERSAGIVPEEADVLLAAADVHPSGFWYEIRAFAVGVMREAWQVRAGFIPADWTRVDPHALRERAWDYHPAFDALREVIFEHEYTDAQGRVYPVRFFGIDAMGHHTAEVYDFVRAHKGQAVPLQGMPNRSNMPYKWSRIDTYPGSNKRIPGGVSLLQLDVNHYKDELSTKLQIAPLDPGAWHFHSETTHEWIRHMCAEYLEEKTNRWVCPDHKQNHGWDCSVYVLALADVLGIKHWPKDREKESSEDLARERLSGRQQINRNRPTWFNRR